MQHYRAFEEVQLAESWATIGTYDGVHLGHRAILEPLVQEAHAAGLPAVVVTFSPHPVVVLRGVQTPICLTTAEERSRLLGELGIDVVLTLTFDRALASWTAEHFMQQMAQHLGLRQLWVGHDFALGRNRQGDIPALREIGKRLGYSLRVTEEVKVSVKPGSDGRISSSRIRALIGQGQVAEAARLLGRPYAVQGAVVTGEKRGRELGFPTANVDYWDGKVTPAYGVYATWAWIDPGQPGERRVPAVTSVGVRPTFDPPILTPRVEAYLIDYTGDLYGHSMKVEFIEFLRPELKFNSAAALITQMELDTQRAREVLKHAA